VLVDAVELAENRREKGPRIVAPAAIGAFVVRDERSPELVGVMSLNHFREEIPASGAVVEGIQDHIPSRWFVELSEIAAVGIGDHGAIPARERTGEELPDGRALARAGATDQLEVLGLIPCRNRLTGECELGSAAQPHRP